MILFFSEGRLGNQLFQYAFLNTIAKEKEIIVSTSMKDLTKNFHIKNPNFKQVPPNKRLNTLLRKFIKPYVLSPLVKLKLISYVKQERKKASSFPTYKKTKGLLPITFIESGFFQSEVFFDKNKLSFSLKETYLNKAKGFLDTLHNDYTKVFVHVRRGDYLYEKYLGEQGLDLPKSYFLKAIKTIRQKIANPFFVFLSDDPGYVECCFSEIHNKVISRNSMGIDLGIMSLCDAGISSNSSFSWWGAYLCNREEVVFPKYWFGWKQKVDSHVNIQPEWGTTIEVT